MRHLKTLHLSLAQAIFGVILGLSVVGTRAAEDNLTTTVLRVEQQRVAALVSDDFPALDRLLADDLTYAHSSTVVESKAEYLASLRSGALKYTSLKHESTLVRVYGDTAVLTGLSTVQALTRGKPGAVKLRFLIVYVQRHDQWQIVAWQSTRLT